MLCCCFQVFSSKFSVGSPKSKLARRIHEVVIVLKGSLSQFADLTISDPGTGYSFAGGEFPPYFLVLLE